MPWIKQIPFALTGFRKQNEKLVFVLLMSFRPSEASGEMTYDFQIPICPKLFRVFSEAPVYFGSTSVPVRSHRGTAGIGCPSSASYSSSACATPGRPGLPQS